MDSSITGRKVAIVLNRIALFRGLLREILMDNDSEFTSNMMSAWAYGHKVENIFIDPGKPMQNGYIESFNGKLRSECLDQHWFQNLSEARELVGAWHLEYNSSDLILRFQTLHLQSMRLHVFVIPNIPRVRNAGAGQVQQRKNA